MDIKEKLQNQKKKRNSGANQNTKILLAFLAGLLVGAILTPFTLNNDTSTIKEDDGITKDSIVANVSEGLDSASLGTTNTMINVENQTPGSFVYIDSVVSSTGGWIVIRQNAYGSPGNVIGTQYFNPGLFSGAVDLLRNTRMGNRYYAVLYNDDGDGIFSIKYDQPIVDSANNVIADTFVAVSINQ